MGLKTAGVPPVPGHGGRYAPYPGTAGRNTYTGHPDILPATHNLAPVAHNVTPVARNITPVARNIAPVSRNYYALSCIYNLLLSDTDVDFNMKNHKIRTYIYIRNHLSVTII